jgi:hypothetical protein
MADALEFVETSEDGKTSTYSIDPSNTYYRAFSQAMRCAKGSKDFHVSSDFLDMSKKFFRQLLRGSFELLGYGSGVPKETYVWKSNRGLVEFGFAEIFPALDRGRDPNGYDPSFDLRLKTRKHELVVSSNLERKGNSTQLKILEQILCKLDGSPSILEGGGRRGGILVCPPNKMEDTINTMKQVYQRVGEDNLKRLTDLTLAVRALKGESTRGAQELIKAEYDALARVFS